MGLDLLVIHVFIALLLLPGGSLKIRSTASTRSFGLWRWPQVGPGGDPVLGRHRHGDRLPVHDLREQDAEHVHRPT